MTAFSAVIILLSCDNTTGDTSKSGIAISFDKEFILADGTDCTVIKVEQTLPDGTTKDITSEADIYADNSRQPLTSNIFSTDKAGKHSFYAVYDVEITEEVSVYAYSKLPQAPADPQESNTAFKHKIMLVQHTGTACVNCPRMMDALKELAQDNAYNTAYTHIACHSYAVTGMEDPCSSEAAANFSRLYNPEDSYPCVTFNFQKKAFGTDVTALKAEINELKKESANVGIAAEAIESDGDILVDVNVKVAQSGNYRIGVWVLEDNIYGIQSGASEAWHNTHENALRAMITNAGSKTIMVGETMEALKTDKSVSKTFRITPESTWKVANCKFVLFVTAPSGDSYDIVNSVVCKVGESIQFDYK